MLALKLKKMSSVLEKEIDEAVEKGFLLSMANDLRSLRQGKVLQEQKPKLEIIFEKEQVPQVVEGKAQEEAKKQLALQQKQEQEQEQEKQAALLIQRKAIEEEEKERKHLAIRLEQDRLAKESQAKATQQEEARVMDQEEKAKAASQLEARRKTKSTLMQRKGELDKELLAFDKRKTPFVESLDNYKKELDGISLKIVSIVEQEKIVEAKKQILEQQESQAENERIKQNIERKRWKVEEQRRQIEKERWFWQLKQAQLREAIHEQQNKLKAIQEKGEAFLEEKKQVEDRLAVFAIEEEQVDLEQQLSVLQKQSDDIAQELEVQQKNQLESEKRLAVVLEEEEDIQAKVLGLEQQESQTSDAEKTASDRALEKERWQEETKRQKIEKERWKLQDSKAILTDKVKELEAKKQKIEIEIGDKEKRLGDIVVLLEHGIEEGTRILEEQRTPKQASAPRHEIPPAPVELPVENVKDIEAPEAIEQAPEAIEQAPEAIEQAPEAIEQAPEAIEQAPEKNSELLKAAREQAEIVETSKTQKETSQEKAVVEEIRQKAREEARAERLERVKRQAFLGKEGEVVGSGPLAKEEILKKLTDISPKEEEERRRFLQRIESGFKFQPAVDSAHNKGKSSTEIIFRPVVQKPAFLERVVIRVVAIVVTVGLLVGGYFIFQFFSNKSGSLDNSNQPATEEQPVVPLPDVNEPTIGKEELPLPFFNVALQEIVGFNNLDELPSLLKAQLLLNQLEAGAYKQIGFRSQQTGKLPSEDEFFSAFQVAIPATVAVFLLPKPMYFVYKAQKGNRFGMVFMQSNAELLKQALADWQKNIASDFENLAFVLFTNDKPLEKDFVRVVYAGEQILCLTYSSEDEGICYAVFDNYFILGTSAELMKTAIDNLL